MTHESILTLRGRVAVVTGGSRNIGFAIAKKFVRHGMQVAILSKSPQAASNAAQAIAIHGTSAIGLECDVTSTTSLQESIGLAAQHFGGIDVLVTSAAILESKSIPCMTEPTWDETLSVNLRGTFFACQQVIPYLKKSEAPRIILISSNAGRMGGFESGLAYAASKGGIVALTYGLARRLGPDGITVNCIAPGTIESDMLDQWGSEARVRLLDRFPLGRFGKAEEVATAACYFASEEAGFTTGAVLDVNGGLFMG